MKLSDKKQKKGAPKGKVTTVPSYSFVETSDPNLKRFVDQNGDWTHYWIEDRKKFVKSVNHILHLGYAKGPRFQEYLLSVSKEEAKKKLNAAGDEGTRTHMAIRDLINGVRIKMTSKYPTEHGRGRMEYLNSDEWENVMAWIAWAERYKPRVISNEFAVYSQGYAGSPDALMVITVPEDDKKFPEDVRGKDVLVMPDWKTSSAIHPEYRSQLAAYWKAVVERGSFKKEVLKFEPSRQFTMIVRLGTKHQNGGYELQAWRMEEIGNAYDRFLAAKMIADDIESDFKPEIEQIPTELFIKLPAVIKTKATKKK